MNVFLIILLVLVYFVIGGITAGLCIRWDALDYDDVEFLIPIVIFWPLVLPIAGIVLLVRYIINFIVDL